MEWTLRRQLRRWGLLAWEGLRSEVGSPAGAAGAEQALQVGNTFCWGRLPVVARLGGFVVRQSAGEAMRDSLKQKFIAVCDARIAAKGPTVGLSFYAFFSNRNDDPESLMEAATWWIQIHRLDHFEKAEKVKALVLAEGL